MLTGKFTCGKLAEAFGIPDDGMRIALSGLKGSQMTFGKVYDVLEAAQAVAEYCESRARDAEVRLSRNGRHGGAYTRRQAEIWHERALRIRREYLRGAAPAAQGGTV